MSNRQYIKLIHSKYTHQQTTNILLFRSGVQPPIYKTHTYKIHTPTAHKHTIVPIGESNLQYIQLIHTKYTQQTTNILLFRSASPTSNIYNSYIQNTHTNRPQTYYCSDRRVQPPIYITHTYKIHTPTDHKHTIVPIGESNLQYIQLIHTKYTHQQTTNILLFRSASPTSNIYNSYIQNTHTNRPQTYYCSDRRVQPPIYKTHTFKIHTPTDHKHTIVPIGESNLQYIKLIHTKYTHQQTINIIN